TSLLSRAVVLDGHRGGDAATNREITDHLQAAGAHGGDHVVEDPVGHGFVEGALIAIAPEVELERLELDTELVRNVLNPDGGKVRLPRERAKAREFRAVEGNQVVAFGARIGERLEVLLWASGHEVLSRALTVEARRNRLTSAVHTISAAGRPV